LQAENRKLFFRLISMDKLWIIIIALLAIIGGLVVRHSRMIDRKNEFLYRHIVRIHKLEKEIRRRRHDEELRNINRSSNSLTNQKS